MLKFDIDRHCGSMYIPLLDDASVFVPLCFPSLLGALGADAVAVEFRCWWPALSVLDELPC